MNKSGIYGCVFQKLIFSTAGAEQSSVWCATYLTLSSSYEISILLLDPEIAPKVPEQGLIKILITSLYFTDSKAEQIPDFSPL